MIDSRLYLYSLQLGLKLLQHGRLKQALRHLARPVNYWRSVEYRLVWEAAGFDRDQYVLDIGSPKLLSLYLADRVGAHVVATDIHDYFIHDYHHLRTLQHVPALRLELRTADGRCLNFPDNTFDVVYAISVVEHIPESGDRDCLSEIRRVLRPGGRAVLTIPFAREARDEYYGKMYWAGASVTVNGQTFFQRRYSAETIKTRLIEPSGLKLRHLRFVGERRSRPGGGEIGVNLPLITGPFQLLMSRWFHVGPVEDWAALANPLCALLVLEKNRELDSLARSRPTTETVRV